MSFDLIDDYPVPMGSPALTLESPVLRAGDAIGRATMAMRPYQGAQIADASEGWRNSEVRRQMIISATGSGKTVTMGGMAKRTVERGKRALMFAHRDELIDQARDKFSAVTGMRVGKEKASERASLRDPIVVSSVQTLRGQRLQSWPKDHFSLIMVDECHRIMAQSYQDVLAHFEEGGARVIGVTATAFRGDKKELGKYFHRTVQPEYPMLQACKDGWLVAPLVKTLPLQIDLSDVKTKRNSDGDTDLDRTEVAHRIEPFLGEIAAGIHREAYGRKVLIFMPSVETAVKMADAMRAVGFRADWVAGDDKERTQKIDRYRSGFIDCLCNAMLLTEGFDCDDVDCVVCLRATKIWSTYVQIVGRGTRPLSSIVPALNAARDAEERRFIIRSSKKPHVLLLDPLWLYEQHSLVSPPELFSRDPEQVKRMAGKQGDLMQIEAEAERDLLETLKKLVRKNQNRKATVVDPFAFAVAIGDADMAQYEPTNLWEMRKPSDKQLGILKNNGIDVEEVKWWGQAQFLVGKILERHKRKLCTVRELNFLAKQGVDGTLMTRAEAEAKIDEIKARWKQKAEDRKAEKEAKAADAAALAANDLAALEEVPL